MTEQIPALRQADRPQVENRRAVFFVSESTGITAETLGHSLLSQFEDAVQFSTYYTPYVNTIEKAEQLVRRFEDMTRDQGQRPVVFATMINAEINAILRDSSCLYVELFDTLIGTLADEFGAAPSMKSGQSHGLRHGDAYDDRMETINFAMNNDDGMRLDNFEKADVILLGVSRSGKTPTCLYLAMHFGLKAANYPLTEEDFDRDAIPTQLLPYREKMFGLSIDPQRLHRVREERRPNSGYSSLARCQSEVKMALSFFDRLNLEVLDTTSHSIEELAARIVKRL